MRRIVLGLDGLSQSDLGGLLDQLPLTRPFICNRAISALDCLPLVSAQAIWAEILTGQPWHKNGCFGYAHPSTSLNSLSITSEKDLLCPVRIAPMQKTTGTSLVVNTPLLQPKPQSRVWLSDGSLPVNVLVSPRSLLSDPLFDQYLPRPFQKVGAIIGTKSASADKCFAIEEHRLKCVAKLLALNDWSECVWRISLFDQLTHFYGIGILAARDLKISERLSRFLESLDNILQRFAKQSDVELTIVSAFSHASCRAKMNLNSVLQSAGALKIEPIDNSPRQKALRIEAQEAVSFAVEPFHLRSTEGRIDTSKTSAASPIYGCVFVNSDKFFSDGIVPPDQHESVKRQVTDYLKIFLSGRYGGAAKIFENPQSVGERTRPTPDLMVVVPEVELTDVVDPGTAEIQTPLTTHSGEGFAILPPTAGTNVKATLKPNELLEVLGEF